MYPTIYPCILLYIPVSQCISMPPHCISTVFPRIPLYIHVSPLYFYCIPTVFLLYPHRISIVSPPYFYCTPTVFLLYFYCTPTVFLLYFYCISIVSPRYFIPAICIIHSNHYFCLTANLCQQRFFISSVLPSTRTDVQ
jgi:hypothetical protein